jgi:hypothetical protein
MNKARRRWINAPSSGNHQRGHPGLPFITFIDVANILAKTGTLQQQHCLPNFGERGRIRTFDPCLKRALLYQLSYAPAVIQFNTLIKSRILRQREISGFKIANSECTRKLISFTKSCSANSAEKWTDRSARLIFPADSLVGLTGPRVQDS